VDSWLFCESIGNITEKTVVRYINNQKIISNYYKNDFNNTTLLYFYSFVYYYINEKSRQNDILIDKDKLIIDEVRVINVNYII